MSKDSDCWPGLAPDEESGLDLREFLECSGACRTLPPVAELDGDGKLTQRDLLTLLITILPYIFQHATPPSNPLVPR